MPLNLSLCATVVALVLNLGAHAQATTPVGVNLQGDKKHDPSTETVNALQTMINWDRAPVIAQNPQGIHLRFAQFDKRKIGDGNFIVYRAYAPGIPTGQRYSLIQWTVGESLQSVTDDVWVNDRGLLMCSKPAKEQLNADSVPTENEVDFVVQAGRGEPKRFALISEDHRTIIPGTLVPYPLEAKDKTCSVQALLASPQGEAFLLEGSGFAPQVEVKLDSVSAGEHQTGAFQSSPTGQLTTTVFPFVEGKDRGIAEIHLSTPDCSLNVKLPWGKDSYHVE